MANTKSLLRKMLGRTSKRSTKSESGSKSPRSRSPVRAVSASAHMSKFLRMSPVKGRQSFMEEELLPGQVFDEAELSESEVSTTASFSSLSSSELLKEDEMLHLRWERALAGRSASSLTASEIEELAARGMPLKYRHALWSAWLSKTTPCDLDVESLQERVPAEAAKVIEADIDRTKTQCMNEENKITLRRVLRACAAANPAVGYCQGMNNIAAVFILLGFDELDVFRGCCSLLKTCCPGYHDRDLFGFRLDAQVLSVLLRRVLPSSTLQRLEALELPLEVLASEHFLTLASKSWSLEATARLWDLLLLEGSPALFASFAAVLELYLPALEQYSVMGLIGEDEEEPVEVFKRNMLRGVTEDVELYLNKVRDLLPKFVQGDIDELRREFGSKKC